MKKILNIILGIALSFSPIITFAETTSTTPPPRPKLQVRQEVEEVRNTYEEQKRIMLENQKNQATNLREQNKDLIKEDPTKNKEQIMLNRDAIKDSRESTTDALKQNREEMRNEVKAKKDEYREEVKKRVLEKTNARLKQAILSLEKLNNRLIDINGRIETRLQKESASTTNSALEKTRTLLNEAKSLVDTVVEKITLAKEKAEIGVSDALTMNELKNAYKDAHDAYKMAKEKTNQTLNFLKELIKILRPVASSTPNFKK